MRKQFFPAFILLALLPSFSYAAAESFRVEIFKRDSVRNTEILPLTQAAEALDQKISVRYHTFANVFAREHNPEAPRPMTQNLGRWESDLTVMPQDNGAYPVAVELSLTLPGGTIKKIEKKLRLEQGGMTGAAEQDATRLRNDFIELARNEFLPISDGFSAEFDAVMVSFTDKHMKEVLAGLPDAVQKLTGETERRRGLLTKRKAVAEKEKTQAEHEASKLETEVRRKFKSVLQERKEVAEETDFVEVQDGSQLSVAPQFARKLAFELTALAENRVERYRFAAVKYHQKTVPLADGQFRTNYRLDVDYMMRDKKVASVNLIYDPGEKDTILFERWKAAFWQRASAKIINGGADEADKLERAYFISLLEPYLFEEQYQLPATLTKARMSFQSKDTQKELAKLRKARGL